MKSRIFGLLCAVALLCGVSAQTQAAQLSPVDLTGEHWKLSTDAEKQAFLYGASHIVVIEQITAEKTGTASSPFVAAWMKAFGNRSWKQIQKQLDDWYVAHPEEAARPVFDVLWYEFMAPAGR